ncbi:MAG TPA: hypothetical protein VIO61_05265 [Anaerolineaceae bacterium]
MNIWFIFLGMLCVLPSFLCLVAGLVIAGLGLLADRRQLQLDANLEKSKVIRWGLMIAGIGLALLVTLAGIYLLAFR